METIHLWAWSPEVRLNKHRMQRQSWLGEVLIGWSLRIAGIIFLGFFSHSHIVSWGVIITRLHTQSNSICLWKRFLRNDLFSRQEATVDVGDVDWNQCWNCLGKKEKPSDAYQPKTVRWRYLKMLWFGAGRNNSTIGKAKTRMNSKVFATNRDERRGRRKQNKFQDFR